MSNVHAPTRAFGLARRTLRIGIAACLAVLVVAGCATPAVRRPDPRGHSFRSEPITLRPGIFAAYSWFGSVHSVSGSWQVPRILGPLEVANAYTWVGAQGPHGSFIQVGVVTDTRLGAGGGDNAYFAAWSDKRKHDVLRPLFPVRPADRVVAELRQTSGKWLVSLVDLTSRHTARFVTEQEGHAVFTRAEWVQEHNRLAHGAVAYPHLSGVSINRVAVNGHGVPYTTVYATWMSIRGSDLAPTPLRGDAFSIQRAEVSPAGERYLQAIVPDDARLKRLDALLDAPPSSVRLAELHTALRSQVQAVRTTNASLERDHWSPTVTPLVRGFLRESEAVGRWCLEGETRNAKNLGAWVRSLPEPRHDFGHLIRQALGLPDVE